MGHQEHEWAGSLWVALVLEGLVHFAQNGGQVGGVGAVDGFELGISVGWSVEGGGHVGNGSEEGARGWWWLRASVGAGGRGRGESREVHGWVSSKFRQHFVGVVRWGRPRMASASVCGTQRLADQGK